MSRISFINRKAFLLPKFQSLENITQSNIYFDNGEFSKLFEDIGKFSNIPCFQMFKRVKVTAKK